MSERVTIEVEGQVARVCLNRPDKRNGLDMAMFKGLIEAGKAISGRNDVRAVVLHGAGKGFCAGLDVMSFMGAGQALGEGSELLERGPESPANLAQRCAWIWQEVPVPVIAAIHGVAFGGGLQLALGADIRYAAPDTQMSVMEIRWGLIPDMSITQTLPRLVRDDIARDLIFTGRVVSAEEAEKIGLVTRVCADPLQEALNSARVIATKSPHAIRSAKRLMRELPTLSREAALKLETDLQVPLLGSPNQLEQMQANMQKREPKFQDPE